MEQVALWIMMHVEPMQQFESILEQFLLAQMDGNQLWSELSKASSSEAVSIRLVSAISNKRICGL